MRKVPTLRERVSQISIGTFIITIAIMLTSFILYSMKKSQIAEDHVIKELTVNLNSQVSQFLPSFLLPEQRVGIDLLLDRIKESENLEDIRIINFKSDLKKGFEKCVLNPKQISRCSTGDRYYTAIVAPLNESGFHFGYLFKAKRNISPGSLKEILQIAGLILFILGLVFSGVYIFITRLLSKTLPTALDELVKFIEADLNGKPTERMQLPFQELEGLKEKISEVLTKYNETRDQAMIGQFTSGIMHDIKTPLQSIVAATHLVEEQSPDSPKRLSRLENLHDMSMKNIPLICNIIETTLDGNRAIKIEKKDNSIINTIESSLSNGFEQARFRNVTINSGTLVDSPVPHDETQLTRVIQNILKNAIEAAAENSTAGIVNVSAKETLSEMILSIEDSGPGFSSSPEKLFSGYKTTKLRGTGLGLLISKKIVEAHGGSIRALSSDLGGAKVEITLPKYSEAT